MEQAKVPILPDVTITLNDGVERTLMYDYRTSARLEQEEGISEDAVRLFLPTGIPREKRLVLLRYLLTEEIPEGAIEDLVQGVRLRYLDDSLWNAFYAALAEDPLRKKPDGDGDAASLSPETGPRSNDSPGK